MRVVSGLAKPPISRGDELKAFFDTDSTNVNKLHQTFFILDSVLFPITGCPVGGMKAIDVDPAVEEENLPLAQAAFVKELGGGSRWYDHFVDCVIKHHHVLPCQ